MKSKYKIIVTILMTIVMIGANTKNVFANSDIIVATAHTHTLTTGTYESYTNEGASGHFYFYQYFQACSGCDYKNVISEKYGTVAHSLSRNNSHVGNKHYFSESCTQCTYSQSYVYPCSGNPCIQPFSIDFDHIH